MSTEEPHPASESDRLSDAEAVFLRTIGLGSRDLPAGGPADPRASEEEALRLLDGYRASEWLESARIEQDADPTESVHSLMSLLRTRIGPYRVRRLLGRSGSTAVYKAWQSDPVPRWVALKVLFDAEEGSETLDRFRREQAVLARMDHSSIARLLDAGSHGGAAWFAMEFVDGDWITRWCRTHRLPRTERVRLVRDAARAVEHAHAKGIIHRDLKPSNILAHRPPRRGDADEPPHVMIIDFGIARGTRGRLQRQAPVTSGAPLLGTLASMAPEQITRGRAGIDVRTDVFALGSILHELAADRPIRDTDDRSLPDLVRQIVEEEPAPLRSLDPTIDRDLEAIAGRALRLDPADRFPTAAALADDLDRWLAGEEVVARRATWQDRSRRWIRRHRRGSTFALAVIMLVVAAVAVVTLVAERRREDRHRRLETIERTLTEVDRLREIAGARSSRAMLSDSLDAESAAVLREDPDDPRALGIRAEVLQHRVRDLTSEPPDSTPRPAVAALTKEMVGLRQRAIARGDSSTEALERLSIAIVLDGDAQRPDLDAVRSRFLQSLAIDESLHAANPGVRRFHDNLAWSHHRLGTLARVQGRGHEAESRFATAVDVSRSLLAAHPDSPFSRLAIGASTWCLGSEIAMQGRLEEAEALLREGVDHLEVAVDQAPLAPVFLVYLLETTHDLASLLLLTDRPDDSLAMLERLPKASSVLLKADGRLEFVAKAVRRDTSLRARIAIARGDSTEAVRRVSELRRLPDRPDDVPSMACLEVELMLLEDRSPEAVARLASLTRDALAAPDAATDPLVHAGRLRDVLAVTAVLESAGLPADPELAAAVATRLASTLDQLVGRRSKVAGVGDADAAALELDLRMLAVELARLRGDESMVAAQLALIRSLPSPRGVETAIRLARMPPRRTAPLPAPEELPD